MNFIEEVIHCLLRLSGAQLYGEIGLIASYTSQVDLINQSVDSRKSFGGLSSKNIQTETITVDSMQDRDKDVITFSGTRSNEKLGVSPPLLDRR